MRTSGKRERHGNEHVAITAKKGCEAVRCGQHSSLNYKANHATENVRILGRYKAQPTEQLIQASPRYTCRRKGEYGLRATSALATKKKAET